MPQAIFSYRSFWNARAALNLIELRRWINSRDNSETAASLQRCKLYWDLEQA